MRVEMVMLGIVICAIVTIAAGIAGALLHVPALLALAAAAGAIGVITGFVQVIVLLLAR